MEELIMSIAVPLARTYGMNKAIEMAYEKLGLDIPKTTEIDVLTGGGINQAFSPANLANMAKRGLVNLGVRSGVKSLGSNISGIMGPAALLGGAVMLGRAFDPTRPGSRNYNPNLAGQMNYLNFNNMMSKDPGTGLAKYGPGSVLAGQNVVSMFGTNDYEKQLQNKIDYFENRIEKGKSYSKKNYEKAKKEQADLQDYNVQKTIETNQFKNLQNINAGNDGAGMQTSGFSNVDGGPVSNRTGRGRQGYGKGGIASL